MQVETFQVLMHLLWLHVLANIDPPALRRRSVTDKLLCNIEAHPNWPLYADVFDHPQKRLVARRPIWADTTLVDQRAQWEEAWLSAAVVNSHLVCDPTNRQPGFDLPAPLMDTVEPFPHRPRSMSC